MDLGIKGRRAIVTGGGSGIGRETARQFLEEGARVVICGRTEAKINATRDELAKLTNGDIHAVQADMTREADIARLVDTAQQKLGGIDILVNNAGTIRRSPAVEQSDEDWTTVLNVNLSSVFRLTQHAGRHMLARGSGKVINIASLLSFQGGILVPAYAAAKGGVAQLTKAFANEWASKGVQVNAIAPGYMATDNTAALRNNPERSRQILERIPTGRWGDPEDLAGAAVFLASAASDYVNGHVLVVDGGWLNR